MLSGASPFLLLQVVTFTLMLLLALVPPALAQASAPAGVAADPSLNQVDYTHTDQSEADFHGQHLASSSFAGVMGRRADFSGADLHGAILTQGSFPEADFSGADLSDALLDQVDFHGADFSGALLRGVIATGSSFVGATVTNADFSDALLDRFDQRALCTQASGIHPTTGVDTRLSLGCG